MVLITTYPHFVCLTRVFRDRNETHKWVNYVTSYRGHKDRTPALSTHSNMDNSDSEVEGNSDSDISESFIRELEEEQSGGYQLQPVEIIGRPKEEADFIPDLSRFFDRVVRAGEIYW